MTDFRDTHPGLTTKTNLWFGKECEGYTRGVLSAFLAGPPSEQEWGEICASGVEQVFLTETFHDWAWVSTVLMPWAELYKSPTARHMNRKVIAGVMAADAGELITRRNSDPRLHRMLVIVRFFDAPWIHDLRAGDQVSVGEPYKLTTFSLVDGVATLPYQYMKDRG